MGRHRRVAGCFAGLVEPPEPGQGVNPRIGALDFVAGGRGQEAA